MAEVYWIHLPEHTDMFSEGYIGFTSKTAKERFKGHMFDSVSSRSGCEVLKRAIRKYGERLIISTICICSNDYGLYLERSLRPTPHIGWNIAVGGGAPMFGRFHTKDVIERQKRSWKESCTPERIALAVSAMHNNRASSKTLSEAQQKIAHLRSLYKGQRVDPFVWVNAEVFLSAFKRGVKKKTVEKALHAPSKKYNTLWKAFESGWRPSEDSDWTAYCKDKLHHFDPNLMAVLEELGSPSEQYLKHNNKRGKNGS